MAFEVVMLIVLVISFAAVIVVLVLDFKNQKKTKKAQEQKDKLLEQKQKEQETQIQGLIDRADAQFFVFKAVYPDQTRTAIKQLTDLRAEDNKLRLEFDEESQKASLKLTKVHEALKYIDEHELNDGDRKSKLLGIKVTLDEAIMAKDTAKIHDVLVNFDEDLLVFNKKQEEPETKAQEFDQFGRPKTKKVVNVVDSEPISGEVDAFGDKI
ncbi:MAG: hypothetical protein LBT17_01090 [Mycoplasmataceae bacterium]|jgi:hypothetical protein|nr:hypothetical protein [Mycoplasmataceae bacterium]